MPVLRFFSSVAQPTTLSGSIGSGATSITVGATTGFPASTPYTLALDYGAATEELVDVTGVAGTNLTVTRGVDGTSAQSHSLGAIVRHVASGRDFADYQTHQAATTAVHGVAGTLVGTSDIQTLANKTLTNPTVNAATFTGTLAGTPTWSGAVVFSAAPSFTGSPVFSGDPDFRGALTTDPALRVRVTADTNPRLNVGADGKLTWGSGAGAGDVELFREAVDVLTSNDTVRVYRPTTAGDAFQSRVTGDTVSRMNIDADGTMSWGPGGAAAQDADFFRLSAGVMKTNNSLTVGTDLAVTGNAAVTGNLTAGNMMLGAWSTWTPTWSTVAGPAPSYGNAVVKGSYCKVGRMVSYAICITFGTTTNAGAGDNWAFTLPGGFTASANFTGGAVPAGFGHVSQSLAATAPIVALIDSGGTLLQLSTAGGRVDGVAITVNGVLDNATPWTWLANSNHIIRFAGQFEATV